MNITIRTKEKLAELTGEDVVIHVLGQAPVKGTLDNVSWVWHGPESLLVNNKRIYSHFDLEDYNSLIVEGNRIHLHKKPLYVKAKESGKEWRTWIDHLEELEGKWVSVSVDLEIITTRGTLTIQYLEDTGPVGFWVRRNMGDCFFSFQRYQEPKITNYGGTPEIKLISIPDGESPISEFLANPPSGGVPTRGRGGEKTVTREEAAMDAIEQELIDLKKIYSVVSTGLLKEINGRLTEMDNIIDDSTAAIQTHLDAL